MASPGGQPRAASAWGLGLASGLSSGIGAFGLVAPEFNPSALLTDLPEMNTEINMDIDTELPLASLTSMLDRSLPLSDAERVAALEAEVECLRSRLAAKDLELAEHRQQMRLQLQGVLEQLG